MKIFKIFLLSYLFIFVTSVFNPSPLAETPKSEQKIAFNFIDVEIPTIIKFISMITGKNFIFDESVKGKITIIAPTKLSVDESFALFTSILELKGFTVVPSGEKNYKIIPSSLARQTGKISIGKEVPVSDAYITRLLPIEHIKASEALKFLRPVISRNGHISAFGPGNLLLVVDSARNIDKLISILKKIDHPPTYEEPPGINVYPLENADATELAKVLENMIKNTRSVKKATTAVQTPFNWISITPDKATNSLIIMASPKDYQNVIQVIKALDKRRRQVFVEAMIIEASMDKLKDLGAKWRAAARHSGEPILIGGLGTIGSNTIQNIINGLTGFTAGGMGNYFDVPITTINSDGTITKSNLTAPGFAALFSLRYFKDAINVLSTPQILTSDNKEAEIVVGKNVPFISKRERDLTTTNTVLSSIERKDVGITLKITPQITEGDYVKLDLYQEISSVKDDTETIIISVGPTTTKRSVKTSVVVKDKQTVVIGGLMQEREEEITEKIPILGDIPLLGWLFKHKNISKNKTNLLVFLTPHIVKDSEDLLKITEEKHKNFAMKEKHYIEGELLLKFKEGISYEKALEIITQKGASIKAFLEGTNVYIIKLGPEQRVEDAVKEFSSMPEVMYAEPNYKIKIQSKISAPDQDPYKKQPVPDVDQTDNKIQNESESSRQDIDIDKKKQTVTAVDADQTNNTNTVLPPESAQIQTINNVDNIKAVETVQRSNKLQEDEKTINLKQLPSETDKEYFIQVGAWKKTKYAQEVLEKLKIYYPDTYIVVVNNFNKVRVPGVMSKKQGAHMLKELKEKFNLEPILVLKRK